VKTRRRALGQHFLHNPRILERIVAAVDPKPGELVLEIGPGRGALTWPLAAKARRVIAVEKDAALIPALEEQKPDNVTIIRGDALTVRFQDILREAGTAPPIKIAGNLPYSISGPFLFKFWEERDLFSRGVFLLQKEVAERIAARPGTKDFAPLSILLQIAFEVKILFKVAPGAFVPPPKVDSALVSFDRRDKPLVDVPNWAGFRKFLNAAFAHRRKTLVNNLAASGIAAEKAAATLAALGLPLKVRPEQVPIHAWAALYAKISAP
jgi:16S rRNA (adenine1518-N6/adenine1519-N6)-dimethyltransferase